MANFFPGPWRISPCFETGIAIESADGQLTIAEVWPVRKQSDPRFGETIDDDAVAQANARLIMQAPRLFWLCDTMLKLLDGRSPRPTQQVFADLEHCLKKELEAVRGGAA